MCLFSFTKEKPMNRSIAYCAGAFLLTLLAPIRLPAQLPPGVIVDNWGGCPPGLLLSQVDLLVIGGTLVTMDPERRILQDGFVAVQGDRIVEVGQGKPASCKRGVSAAEQIRGGVTTFADMYYFEDVIAEEAKAAGMRGVMGETILDFPAPDNKSNAAMLEYTEKFLKRWQGDALIHAAVAPHSIYTCSPKTLEDAAALARKYSAPILIHVAEMKKELDNSRAQNGTTPVQYLDKLGILGPDIVAAHCIFVDETDRKILAQRQVGCVHNPSSNMMLASGVAPVIEERAAGVAVGLGTDGPAGSNNDLDLMEEMDLAAKLQKITKMDPQALGAKTVVEMATIEGARALHMGKEIGSLEAGKKADLIVIGLDAPNGVPMYDVYAQLAYALKGSDVETVIIGGRVVMRDKKLLTVDEPAAIAKAKEFKNKVQTSLK